MALTMPILFYLAFGLLFASENPQLQVEKDISDDKVIQGEPVEVRLSVINVGPKVEELIVEDLLPDSLQVTDHQHKILTDLGEHDRCSWQYTIETRRGYYWMKSVMATMGETFGIFQKTVQLPAEKTMMVVPRITRLKHVTIRPRRTRVYSGIIPAAKGGSGTDFFGIREYQTGDSPRLINWKASANVGRLQVKKYEPAISLETVLFLNLNSEEYDLRSRTDASELAIVIAASVANHLVEKRQKVGLVTNGLDPLTTEGQAVMLSPRKGRGHLMKVLEVLARVEAGSTSPFIELLRQKSVILSWGTTAIIITPQETPDLLAAVLRLRQQGFHVVLVIVEMGGNFNQTRQRAAQIGIPAYHIWRESELDMWR